MGNVLLRTPLYAQHLAARARMVPFAGYEMPVQYAGVLEEAKQVRAAAGLFDVSHMAQLSIRGKQAREQIDRLVTGDLSRLEIGQAQYNMVCNPEGGVIDDVVVYLRSAEEIFMCVNASNRHAVVAWFRDHLGKSVTFEDQSDALALLALQGPLAEQVLSTCSDSNLVRGLKYYRAASTTVFGVPCYLSRTGYTGEDGFEIYLENASAAQVWESLLEAGKSKGIGPAGLGARDTLRLEMGYPLHGYEISANISPYEAGLPWVVKLGKAGGFIGQPALEKVSEQGPKKVLKGFAVEDRRLARQGAKVFTPSKVPVGEITSGTFSPHLHHPIALGFLDAAHGSDKDFLLEVRDQLVPMHVHPLPFVPSHTKKKAG